MTGTAKLRMPRPVIVLRLVAELGLVGG